MKKTGPSQHFTLSRSRWLRTLCTVLAIALMLSCSSLALARTQVTDDAGLSLSEAVQTASDPAQLKGVTPAVTALRLLESGNSSPKTYNATIGENTIDVTVGNYNTLSMTATVTESGATLALYDEAGNAVSLSHAGTTWTLDKVYVHPGANALRLTLSLNGALVADYAFNIQCVADCPSYAGSGIAVTDGAATEKWFSFTPTSTGRYALHTTGTTDTTGIVYQTSPLPYIALGTNSTTDGKFDPNFNIPLLLEGGSTYYIQVQREEAGNYTFYAALEPPVVSSLTLGSAQAVIDETAHTIAVGSVAASQLLSLKLNSKLCTPVLKDSSGAVLPWMSTQSTYSTFLFLATGANTYTLDLVTDSDVVLNHYEVTITYAPSVAQPLKGATLNPGGAMTLNQTAKTATATVGNYKQQLTLDLSPGYTARLLQGTLEIPFAEGAASLTLTGGANVYTLEVYRPLIDTTPTTYTLTITYDGEVPHTLDAAALSPAGPLTVDQAAHTVTGSVQFAKQVLSVTPANGYLPVLKDSAGHPLAWDGTVEYTRAMVFSPGANNYTLELYAPDSTTPSDQYAVAIHYTPALQSARLIPGGNAAVDQTAMTLTATASQQNATLLVAMNGNCTGELEDASGVVTPLAADGTIDLTLGYGINSYTLYVTGPDNQEASYAVELTYNATIDDVLDTIDLQPGGEGPIITQSGKHYTYTVDADQQLLTLQPKSGFTATLRDANGETLPLDAAHQAQLTLAQGNNAYTATFYAGSQAVFVMDIDIVYIVPTTTGLEKLDILPNTAFAIDARTKAITAQVQTWLPTLSLTPQAGYLPQLLDVQENIVQLDANYCALLTLHQGENTFTLKLYNGPADPTPVIYTISVQCDVANPGLVIADGFISNIQTGSVASFLDSLAAQLFLDEGLTHWDSAVVLAADGTPLAADALLPTGAQVTVVAGKDTCAWTALVYGDIDGDGLTTTADLEVLQSHLLRLELLPAPYSIAADLNRDGKIDMLDNNTLRAMLRN